MRVISKKDASKKANTTYIANGGGADALIRGLAQTFGKGDEFVSSLLKRGDGVRKDNLSIGGVRIGQEI